MHVYKPGDDPVPPLNLLPVFNATARWLSKPTAAQIIQMQQLFPRLKAESATALLQKAREGGVIELGRFTEVELQERRSQMKVMGVNADLNLTHLSVRSPK